MRAQPQQHCYLGLDPGKSGAVAVINQASEVLLLSSLPLINDATGEQVLAAPQGRSKEFRLDYKALRQMLGGFNLSAAAVEQMEPYGVNAYTALSIGITFGLCLAAVEQSEPERLLLPPAKSWKAYLKLSSDKTVSVERAQATFTGLPKRMRHDKAEALLLAHYALRVTTGTPNP